MANFTPLLSLRKGQPPLDREIGYIFLPFVAYDQLDQLMHEYTSIFPRLRANGANVKVHLWPMVVLLPTWHQYMGLDKC